MISVSVSCSFTVWLLNFCLLTCLIDACVKPELALNQDLRDGVNEKEVSWRLQATSAVMIVFPKGHRGGAASQADAAFSRKGD